MSSKSDDQKNLRNIWSSYIYTGETEYSYSKLGGIDAFDILVQNNTDYTIDEVVVKVDYIKKAGGVFKSERVTVYNIPPHSSKDVKAPESDRGTSGDLQIMKVSARDFNFCYPGNQIDVFDSYKCN